MIRYVNLGLVLNSHTFYDILRNDFIVILVKNK